jgi:large subunit ribosomal protein L37Ae
MTKTKKVGMTGKFGSRYGLRIRTKILKVEQKKTNQCPHCYKKQLKRLASGIWLCKSCNVKFAGGAYIPERVEEKE